MHVHLKDGDQRRRIEDIQLKDGFYPCVGGRERYLSDPSISRTQMEPAIWFKVLVLESVSVDCNQRTVSWTTGKRDGDSVVVHSSSYSEGECYDYDADVDDLFSLAAKIMNCSDSDVDDQDFEQCLLRMLHCYILPKIPLHMEDLEKIQLAMNKQVECIHALDEEVVAHCHGIESCYSELDVLRSDFLPDLEEMITSGECSKTFLETLLSDVKKEEKNTRTKIDKAQDNVELAKAEVDKQPYSDEVKDNLAGTRLQRNNLQEKVKMLIIAREEIKSWLQEVSEQSGDNNEMLQSYRECRNRLQLLKQERDKFLQYKRCALSVREMMEGAISALKESGSTDANDANAQGHRSCDVLLGDWRPEWQRLGERVATILNNDEHPIGKFFQDFCLQITETCQRVIDMGRKRDKQKGRNSMKDCSPFGRMDHSDVAYEMSNIFDFEDFVSEFFKRELEQIRTAVLQHLAKATELLADQFNHREKYYKNKLRLCYEQCFFDRTHCFIECVYELAHHQHVEETENDVKRLRKLPIKLLHLQMKDEWWLALFDQRARLGSVGQQAFSAVGRDEERSATNGYTGLFGSYDMIDELLEGDLDGSTSSNESCNGVVDHAHVPITFSDVDNVRSLAIKAIRKRSRTVNGVDDDREGLDIQHQLHDHVDSDLSHSAPNPHLSLGEIMDRWESNGMDDQLARRYSKSHNDIARQTRDRTSSNASSHADETFQEHFGPALQNIRDILRATSPIAKLKCLTASLKKIASKVSELRQQEGVDQFKAALTAEDLLPLLVLMLLQMEPWETAVIWPQVKLIDDLMAPFLCSGCHGWALSQFQAAIRILSELCHEF